MNTENPDWCEPIRVFYYYTSESTWKITDIPFTGAIYANYGPVIIGASDPVSYPVRDDYT